MHGQPERVLDEYLVLLARDGSREAFDHLVRRWMPRLVRYTTRTMGEPELARDIAQETWVAVIRGLKRLDDTSQFRAWLYRVAHRKCVDAIRGNQRHRRLIARAQAEPEEQTSASSPASTREIAGLAGAISQLPPEQRDVVHLFYGEELSIAEVAAVLKVPGGTVKSRLHHARETLKKQLGE
jgi:RNA polymerase sigma-70 factor (ECF subfamily)